MMEDVFTVLTRAVEGSAGLALTAAFAWGVLSILLSPCHLASIPLIVGFVDRQGRITAWRAFTLSLVFATGILITIGVIGVLTAMAGRMMGDLGRWGNYAVALVMVGIGLCLLDVIRLPWPGGSPTSTKRKGWWAALLLGLIFGAALGPCTFAFMAPMLAVTFKLATSKLPYGILLLMLYGAGHCSVIVLAGTCTELVQRYLDWNERSQGAVILRRVCGLLVVLGGLYLMYVAR